MRSTSAKLGLGLGLVPALAVAALAVFTPGNANASVVKASVPACTTANLTAQITDQGWHQDVPTEMGLMNLVNTSKRACTVDGTASVTLFNAAGERVKVPTTKVNQPGKATVITLKPGGGAFEGFKWQPCSKGDETCGVGNYLQVGLETSATGVPTKMFDFPAEEASNITMRWLQVGTLQPSNQGVVAW